MAEIQFRPIYSHCHKIIYEEVDFVICDSDIGDICRYPHKYNIIPDKCPNCGEGFDSIIMPTKLPFNFCSFECVE